ncbi:hypothetical protein SAMN05421747_103179 [Parapedobacter composti]|uniref:Uncharacterized protein n=1 Tax=Parapedobacter composti TaxID=623281 RepID=A0A1I1FUT1_9SPHI|nr:hypothetical protein [Parapedobacter composti]SFC03207.1 hypothetical protein SAMN05421747_103179 [Parapedobacter composti]
MRKESKIKNLHDLRAEITRLKALAREQERYLDDQYLLLQAKIEAPYRFLKSALSWVPGANTAKGLFAKRREGEDWLSRALRIGLPVVLNRLFLRKAGFFKRALVTLLSQQAAGALNKDRLSAFINKVTDLIRPSGKKRRPRHVDYGIPPDSETY